MHKLSLIMMLFLATLKTLGQDLKTTEDLNQALEILHRESPIVGFSVAVVNEDRILYNEGYGHSNLLAEKAYTPSTIQNIASISKTFIGVALLKAAELGHLSLDDPINQYLPFEVKNPYFPHTEITIRHLCTHTSSIRDTKIYQSKSYVLAELPEEHLKVRSNFNDPDQLMDLDEFFASVLSSDGRWFKKNIFLKEKPGQKFKYSNLGAALAALVLERATGIAFDDFTKQHIFQPLLMRDTGWFLEKVNSEDYSVLYEDSSTPLAKYQLITYPDGGLITSSQSLALFLQELIAGQNGNGKLLSPDSYQELFDPRLNDSHYDDRNESAYNDEYNFGVFMGLSAKNKIGHTGGDPGVVTMMFFDKNSGIGKLMVCNTDLDKAGVENFIKIWQTLEKFENDL